MESNQRDSESEGTPLLQPQQEAANYSNAYSQPMAPQPVAPQMAMNPNMNMNMNGNNPNPMAHLASLAAQYEQAGYSPSDAAAAASSMATYQQQQHQMYSAFGYPPPTQAQAYYAAQGQQFQGMAMSPQAPIPMPVSPQAAPSSSRPPRASRRASSPVLPETGSGNNSNSLPPLQDIFSSNNNDSVTSFNSAINNNSNYGSIAQPSPIWSAPPPGTNTYGTGGASRVQPVLVRTSSSGSMARLSNSPKPSKPRGHRRSSSDMPIRQSHRRTASAESPLFLPPLVGGSGHRRTGSFGGGGGAGGSVGGNRQRAMSSGSNSRPPRRGSGHRRTASSGSVGTFASQMSTTSVRSNIVKSSMFGGFDAHTGQVQMHFPFEAVRLVFVDDEEDPNVSKQTKRTKQPPPADPHSMLTQGHLYMEGHAADFDDFEDYTNITNAMEEGLTPEWETMDRVATDENNNVNMNSILKPPSYLLPVSTKVYKRMMGEIADAQNMPCGLFFCGHHEDVAHPSIAIAVVIVMLLFGFMAYVAFFIEGS